MILFFLTSGLFLGWSLGANDAANVFGSAVGSKMVRFKKAALIASIFVILGAVIQGAGASHTLGKLGSVSALAGSFTVALAAAITVFSMTKWKIPVSTSQAIVGAIIGWNFYTGNPTDTHSLTQIVLTWVTGPVLGAIFAIIIYFIISLWINKSKIHLLKLDASVRFGLLVVGAFGSYSLGANNIANVMGVFVPAISLEPISFGIFTLSGAQQLFLLGSIAIAAGIVTYSRRVMDTVGNDLMELSPVSALVVVFSHSLVLFVFSSQSLSNLIQSIGLPPIPLVPVSSSQAIVGAILGLGLMQGAKNVNFKILGGISLGWITTPIIAGLIAFISLFFVNNVFKLEVANDIQEINTEEIAEQQQNIIIQDSVATEKSLVNKDSDPVQQNYRFWVYIFIPIVLVIVATLILFLVFVNRRKLLLKKHLSEIKEKDEEIKMLKQEVDLFRQKKQVTQTELETEINYKQNQMMTLALNIIQKNEFIQSLKSKLNKLKSSAKSKEVQHGLQKLSTIINEHLYLDKDRKTFQIYVEELHQDFYLHLQHKYSDLTTNEKRLCALLRLDLSSKEIASILNISPKSVEMNRYRLRKKMKISSKENLVEIIKNI